MINQQAVFRAFETSWNVSPAGCTGVFEAISNGTALPGQPPEGMKLMGRSHGGRLDL